MADYTSRHTGAEIDAGIDLTNTNKSSIESLDARVDEIEGAVSQKVDKVAGKGLSTNDYTTADKNKLASLPTGSELSSELGQKQDTIDDLSDIRSGAAAGATAYQKPQTGIPGTDLAEGVIPDISEKADKAGSLSQPFSAKYLAVIGRGTDNGLKLYKADGIPPYARIITEGDLSSNGIDYVLPTTGIAEGSTVKLATEKDIESVEGEVSQLGLNVHNELYALKVDGSVSAEQTGRNKAYELSLESGKHYVLVLSVSGLTNTDIENLQYFRISTSSSAEIGTLLSHTFDSDDISALKSTGDWSLEYTAEQNSGYIQLFFNSGYTPTAGNIINITKKTDKPIYETVENVADGLSKKEDNYLKGKTIVCFGDSITEFYGEGTGIPHKRYSDFIEDMTGATAINVGIGGTCLRERANPVITSETYSNNDYAALDIVNMVRSACGIDYDEETSYLDLARAAALHIYTYKETHDDNRPIVERLAAIDWSKVDYVTFLAGTNDWNGGNKTQWGESGSTDVETTIGAVNEIIRILLTTYPHIKIVWFTPIVRWIGYNGTEETMIPANFSDSYAYDGVTLKKLSAQIQCELTLRHIPVCDFYSGLGWNMSNFAQYFGNNSVHPYRGFEYIARKIVDFLKSGGSNTRDIADKSDIYAAIDEERQRAIQAEREIGDWEDTEEYIKAELDSEGRILSGVKTDGTYTFNKGVEVSQAKKIETVEDEAWVEVKVDREDKIIEGIEPDGSKHISKFNNYTKALIKGIASTVDTNINNTVVIPVLDANFDTSLPYKVYDGDIEDDSVKGTPDAKYVFELPLKDSYHIRFRFRITEDLLGGNAVNIASLNGAVVKATPIALTQGQETVTVGGTDYTENWPYFKGGIALNGTTIEPLYQRNNLGGQAFSVKYVGSGSAVTISNNGTAIVLTVDGTDTTYTLANYDDMSELYAALAENTDLEVKAISIDKHLCSELAAFGAISLKETYHFSNEGTPDTVTDAAPFYLRYAVSDEWHKAELLKIGSTIYSVCDGQVLSGTPSAADNKLILGGECGVLFKDLRVVADGSSDAELVSGKIVSEFNPSILVFEAHGLYDGPAYTVTPAESEDGMSSLNPDTMAYFFGLLQSKGYMPVSVEDIADFYVVGKQLPKRCYTIIFDDYRWSDILDNNFRAVMNRYGVKPALAIITSRNATITHNGQTITEEVAARMVSVIGGSLVSHTHDHRGLNVPPPSDFATNFLSDIYDADVKYVNGSILVYPGGNINRYGQEVMESMGFKAGIEVYHQNSTGNTSHNRFYISRINIGRIIYSNGDFYDYSVYTDKMI